MNVIEPMFVLSEAVRGSDSWKRACAVAVCQSIASNSVEKGASPVWVVAGSAAGATCLHRQVSATALPVSLMDTSPAAWGDGWQKWLSPRQLRVFQPRARTKRVSPVTLRGVEDGHGQGIHDWTRIVRRGDRNASAHASMVCRGEAKERGDEVITAREDRHARTGTPAQGLRPRSQGAPYDRGHRRHHLRAHGGA